MKNPTPCPNRDQFIRLLSNQLSGEEEKLLTDHVGHCPACQQKLQEWAFDDESWRRVADVLRTEESSVAKEAALRDVLQKLQQHDARTVDVAGTPAASAAAGVLDAEVAKALGLPERYQMEGEVARGGMGAILKGHDVELGRDIAVKVMLETHQGKTELLQRFVEEAQIGGQLQHPGIVPIYDIGRSQDKRPYFTMKLIEGKTLAALLKKRSDTRLACHKTATGEPPVATDLPRFLGIFEQICQTLAYAHSRGVIHRDLKPANIMVGSFGEVQVMDWGLAKFVSGPSSLVRGLATEVAKAEGAVAPHQAVTPDFEHRTTDHGPRTRAGAVMGTPAFMPPEQANGKIDELDARCDVFGLGAILCVILTGKPPYIGKNGNEVHQKAMAGDLADATERLDQCGAEAKLIALTQKCLAPNKEDRQRDAGEVAEAVTAYLESVQKRLKQAEIETAQANTKAQEERKRRRVLLALAASVLLFVIGVAGAGLWYQQDRAVRQTAELLRQKEEQRNHELREQRIAEALNQAHTIRNTLHTKLAEKGGVFKLLNDPADWQRQIEAARATLRRANDMKTGAERKVDAGLVKEMHTLTTQLQDDNSGRRLALRLEQIRLMRSDLVRGKFKRAEAIKHYAKAFRDAHLNVEKGDLNPTTRQIQLSSIREQLAAALDDWAFVKLAERKKVPERLLQLARLADPGPWRDQFRNPRMWRDRAEFNKLTDKLLQDEKNLTALSPQMLNFVGSFLRLSGGNAIEWLDKAQRLHPDDFWLNYEMAAALGRRNQLERSAGYFRAALAIRPGSAVTWYGLAIVLERQEEFSGAAAAGKNALKFDQQYAAAWDQLGNIYSKQKKYMKAFAYHQKAVESDPDDPLAWYNLGTNQMRQKHFKDAIASLRKAVDRKPGYVMAWTNLAFVLNRQKDYAGAVKACKKALAIDPQFANALANLGLALAKQDNVKEAIAYCRKAIQLKPKSAPAWNTLGIVMRDAKDNDGAIAAFKKAILFKPTFAFAWNNLGNVLRQQKRRSEAKEAYRRATQIDPQFAAAWNSLGKMLMGEGEKNAAIDAFQKATQSNPRYVKAWGNLGAALVKDMRLDEALAALNRAVAIEPQNAQVWVNIGALKIHQKNYKEAIQALEKAVAINPKLPQCWSNLGVARASNGDTEGALEALEKATKVDPRFAEGWANLGNLLADNGDFKGAVNAYNTIVEIDPNLVQVRYGFREIIKAYAAASRDGSPDTQAWSNLVVWCRKALTLYPNDVDIWVRLGVTLRYGGDNRGAAAAYRHAAKINPKLPNVWFNLGNTLGDLNDLEGAVAAYQNVVKIDPNDFEAWYTLGLMLRRQKDYDAAVVGFKMAVKINPKYAKAHLNLGLTRRDQGNFSAAISHLKKGVELLPPRHASRLSAERYIKGIQMLQALEKKLPMALSQATIGNKTNATEQLAMAELCRQYLSRYRDAVQLYSTAFAKQPKLAGDLLRGNGYNAARAAALAAAGKGKDADKIQEKERAGLRQKAHEWLQADLDDWRKLLDAKPQAAVLLQERLQDWQKDPDLISVRDAKPQAALPEVERKSWVPLWSNVEALRKKARGSYQETILKGSLVDGKRKRTHEVKLTAGKTYIIDMQSKQFDTFLRLEDANGKKLIENDDIDYQRRILNSRLSFTPKQSGVFRLIATSYRQQGRGAYEIIIREFAAKKSKRQNRQASAQRRLLGK